MCFNCEIKNLFSVCSAVFDAGYQALGDMVCDDIEQTPCDRLWSETTCVRADLIELCSVGDMIANDVGVTTGARASFWAIEPTENSVSGYFVINLTLETAPTIPVFCMKKESFDDLT